MSVRASLGSWNALTTAPGTACRIFSGHDASTSGGSNRILKLIALLLVVWVYAITAPGESRGRVSHRTCGGPLGHRHAPECHGATASHAARVPTPPAV